MIVNLSIENRIRTQKPTNGELAGMTNYFGSLSANKELEKIADCVGRCGTTFSPAVFSAPHRCGENFVEMQLFALDFDTGIRFKEIKNRLDKYNLPIVFAYHTFNSQEDLEKFRIVLLHECPVNNRKAAEIILQLLMKIFPESDPHCKDVARLYCGGKDLFYYDEEQPTFNIEDLVIATVRLKEIGMEKSNSMEKYFL